MKQNESGFSLLEMCVVIAVILIVGAIAVPSLRTTMDNYRLSSSGQNMAEMLTKTRMMAIKFNQPYLANISGANPMQATAQSAAAVLAGNPLGPGDPRSSTASGVAVQTAALPANLNFQDLTNYLGAATPTVTDGEIGFNARGIPCVRNAVNPYVCPDPNNLVAPPGQVAFIWFMKSSVSQSWEAVTVTPAGRIRSWRQTSSSTWQ